MSASSLTPVALIAHGTTGVQRRYAVARLDLLVSSSFYGVHVLLRYRYRIEPTLLQQREIARVFGCCRVVFNDALRLRGEAYRAGLKLSDTEIQRRVTTLAKTTVERAWLTEVPSVALVQAANDARRAFRNYFDSRSGKRKSRAIGRPRMKSKKDCRQSFRLTRNGFRVRPNGRLFVAKVGELRVRWSRKLPSEPSSVTIIREPDGKFYASFVVDLAATPLPVTRREAGVDVGIVRLATIADTAGARVDVANPRYLQRKLRKLARLEREKSRRQKGSINRHKSRRKIAIQHGKVARARRDYHHKQALALVGENQVIYVENLNIAGMLKNRRLARTISDAAWGSVHPDHRRENSEVRSNITSGVAVAGIKQDMQRMRICSRCAALESPHLDMPDMRYEP